MIGSKGSFLLGFYFFHRIHSLSVFSCVGVCFPSSQVFLKFRWFSSSKPKICQPENGQELPGQTKRKGDGIHSFIILPLVCQFS